jgi:aryl-alcohol dehydrogenase-like predicted oxidoreductase
VRYRALGTTGVEVSEVGYGAWGLGGDWGETDDRKSVRALHRAIDLGVNFIDTALVYGDGRSERLAGQVVRERSETVRVATKVPPANGVWPAPPGVPADEVFPAEHLRECVERSLANLGLDRIDLLQLHVWDDGWLEEGGWRSAIDEMRAAGKIEHFGVSLNDNQPTSAMRLVQSGAVDAVQVVYNVFEAAAEDELLPACRERGIGVIARVPLDEGGLTGTITPDTEFADDDFRAGYFRGDRRREVFERVNAIAGDLGIAPGELPELALRFVLGEKAVSTVIPGMRSIRNVERNVAVADGRILGEDRREALRPHRWLRNFYR